MHIFYNPGRSKCNFALLKLVGDDIRIWFFFQRGYATDYQTPGVLTTWFQLEMDFGDVQTILNGTLGSNRR